jgi:hypothetical protein
MDYINTYIKIKLEQIKEKLLEVPDMEDEIEKVATFNYLKGIGDTLEELINVIKIQTEESESDE